VSTIPGLDEALKRYNIGRPKAERQYDSAPRKPRKKKGRRSGRSIGSAGFTAKQANDNALPGAKETDRLVGKATESVLTAATSRAGIAALKRVPMGTGAIGLAIAAGLAAYGLTTYVINRLKEKKEGRAQLAYQASQAYRAARSDLAERQGQALSTAQLTQLSLAFKQKLGQLGLTSTDLGGL